MKRIIPPFIVVLAALASNCMACNAHAEDSTFVIDASSHEALRQSLERALDTATFAEIIVFNEDLKFLEAEAGTLRYSDDQKGAARSLLELRKKSPFVTYHYDHELRLISELMAQNSGQTGRHREDLFDRAGPFLHGKTFAQIHSVVEERIAIYKQRAGAATPCRMDLIPPDVFVYGVGLRNPIANAPLIFGEHPFEANRVDLRVPASDKPVYLVLSAGGHLVWNLVVEDPTKLKGILLWGGYPQALANIPDGVPVQMYAVREKGETSPCDYKGIALDVSPDLLEFDAFLRELTGRSMDRFDAFKKVGQISLDPFYDKPNKQNISQPQDDTAHVAETWPAPEITPQAVTSKWAYKMPPQEHLELLHFMKTATIHDLVEAGYLRTSSFTEFDELYIRHAQELADQNKVFKHIIVQIPKPVEPLYRVSKAFPIREMRNLGIKGASILADKPEDLGITFPIRDKSIFKSLKVALYFSQTGLCTGHCTSACISEKAMVCKGKAWDE